LRVWPSGVSSPRQCLKNGLSAALWFHCFQDNNSLDWNNPLSPFRRMGRSLRMSRATTAACRGFTCAPSMLWKEDHWQGRKALRALSSCPMVNGLAFLLNKR